MAAGGAWQTTSFPVVVQQHGATAGAQLRQRFAGAVIRDAVADDGADLADLLGDAAVLLAAPARWWALRERPAGWPFALQWAQLPGAGWDGYPDWLFEVPCVTVAPGLNSVPIAEFCLAAMLAHEKSHRDLWIGSAREWRPRRLGGLEGKTLGLAGFGNIGQRVSELGLAFGMDVVAARRDLSAATSGVRLVGAVAELAPLADHLVLCLPYGPATHHLIDAAFLGRCKPNLHIVNVARGGLVDHQALITALTAGTIAAATLDVTDPEPLGDGHPLYAHPAVRISPHVAWSDPRTTDRLVSFFGDQLELFQVDKCVRNVVSHPSCRTEEMQP